MLLEKKNAVIYGAGGAIGGAIARAFAREGAKVFLAGRTRASVDAVAEEISAAGGAIETAQVDALDEHAVETYADAVVKSVAATELGKASGAFNMLRQLGAAFGVAILAAVFAGVGSFHSAQAFSNGFAPAMGVSAALSLVGAIAGPVLPGRRDMAFVRTTAQAPETREHEPYGLPEQSPSL